MLLIEAQERLQAYKAADYPNFKSEMKKEIIREQESIVNDYAGTERKKGISLKQLAKQLAQG